MARQIDEGYHERGGAKALLRSVVNFPRIARRQSVWLDVGNHHRVRPDPRMRADLDRPKDLGAGPDVDMAGNFGNPAAATAAKRDLVEIRQFTPILASG
ncbi:hypothetical protein [Bradyrhizobium sp. AZCC 1693]|uniref:hypothetical protein n=1 Tax=Bradyrhizobium sp. AZCC 1693 TaxID=3117029 RepID=UPI002FEF51AF